MGYRSEVLIIVRGEPSAVRAYQIMWFEQVRTLRHSSGFMGEGDLIFDSLENTGEVNTFGDTTEWELHFDSIKWYASYPEIQAYNRIITECPDMLHAEMMRIGEEDDDIEHNLGGCAEYDPKMFVARSIERY